MYAYKESTLSKANVKQVTYGVYYTNWLKNFSFGFFFVLSLITMGLCIFLFLVLLRRKVGGGDDAPSQKPFFDDYIDGEIN